MTVDHWERIYTTRPTDGVGWYEPDPVISPATGRGGRRPRGTERHRYRRRRLVAGRSPARPRSGSHRGPGHRRVRTGRVARTARRAGRRRRVGRRRRDRARSTSAGSTSGTTERSSTSCSTRPRRARYVALARRTVPPGGMAIMATFAGDGPERCSGLPVCRYEPEALAQECGPAFRLTSTTRHLHHTPLGVPQAFQYSTFERVAVGREVGPGRLGRRARRPQPQPERSRRSIRSSWV